MLVFFTYNHKWNVGKRDCMMKRWVNCLPGPQQACDEQRSPEPLLDFIKLQLLIINLHPTGLRWPKCAIMGLAWKMTMSIVHRQSSQTVQNRLRPLNEFTPKPFALFILRERRHADNVSFALRGWSLLPKNPPENEIARRSSSKQSLFASLNISVGVRHDVQYIQWNAQYIHLNISAIILSQKYARCSVTLPRSKIRSKTWASFKSLHWDSFWVKSLHVRKQTNFQDIAILHTKHTNRLTKPPSPAAQRFYG